MYGTFAEDVRRWADIWVGNSGRRVTPVVKLRLLWTHQPLHATALFRLGAWCARRRFPVLPGILRRLTITLYGLDIVSGIPVGGGFYLPHTVGTVIMAQRIGRNVTIVSNVTLGMRHGTDFPIIGDDVYIGAGARILGAVTVGDGAVIGANAVVLTDVPANATAVGVPARIIQRRENDQLDVIVIKDE